jgi:hypothetical protein
MDPMRPIDGNGHVPDPEPTSYQLGYSAGYNAALIDFFTRVAQFNIDQIDAVLAKFESRRAAGPDAA